MKKPVILLVDDDSSVLEALEAALDPVFGEIARIEAFAYPNEVLAEIPRWAEEERPVAVAIVDQKMPGMTGVELIQALREGTRADGESGGGFDPADATRAILLTGYAGLDSALQAKNAASIDRYLEKPWNAARIQTAVRETFTAYLAGEGRDSYFVLREVSERSELEQLLRLRYEIYRVTTGIKHVLPRDGGGMDADPYDAVSRFFGLFHETLTDSTMIGTLRVAGQEPGPAAPILREILREHPKLLARLEGQRNYPLPLMEYLVERSAVATLIDALLKRGERIVEPGRLTLQPTFRTAVRGGRRLGLHIIEGAVAFFFFFFCIENAILTCVPTHARFYFPFGFRRVPGTTDCFQPILDGPCSCLHGTITTVPASRRDRVSSLAQRIRASGGMCRCATFPACLAGPYETGKFAATDLFCPLAARKTVNESTD